MKTQTQIQKRLEVLRTNRRELEAKDMTEEDQIWIDNQYNDALSHKIEALEWALAE